MERDQDLAFLGAVLRRARLAAGITSQDALADRLGYERTVIAKAESGQRPPSPDVARAYAREFPQLNALMQSGLIEEWAEHVRKNGGIVPAVLRRLGGSGEKRSHAFLLGTYPGARPAPGRAVCACDPRDRGRG